MNFLIFKDFFRFLSEFNLISFELNSLKINITRADVASDVV